MKYLLLGACLILFITNASNAIGQENGILWGEKYEMPNEYYNVKQRLPLSDGRSLVWESRWQTLNYDHRVTIFDQYNRIENQGALEIQVTASEKEALVMFHEMNGEICVITNRIDSKNKSSVVYLNEFNEQSISIGIPIKTMATIDESSLPSSEHVIDYSYSRLLGNGGLRFLYSPNKEYLLGISMLPRSSNPNIEYRFIIFDQEGNVLKDCDVEIPARQEQFMFEECHIDNDGSIHIAGRIFKDLKASVMSLEIKDEHQIMVGHIPLDVCEMKSKNLDFNNNIQVPSLKVSGSKNMETVVASLVSYQNKRGKTKGVNGVKITTINWTKDDLIERFEEFPFDIIESEIDEKENKKRIVEFEDKKHLTEVEILYSGRMNNGAVAIVCEDRSSDGGSSQFSPYDNFNDLFVTFIDVNGEIFKYRIPRLQRIFADYWSYLSSASVMTYKDELLIFFYDERSNTYDSKTIRSMIKPYELLVYRKPEDSSIKFLRISQDGKIENYNLSTSEDVDINPEYIRLLNNQVFFLGHEVESRKSGTLILE